MLLITTHGDNSFLVQNTQHQLCRFYLKCSADSGLCLQSLSVILSQHLQRSCYNDQSQQHLIKRFIYQYFNKYACRLPVKQCNYHKNVNRHVARDSLDTNHTKISKSYFSIFIAVFNQKRIVILSKCSAKQIIQFMTRSLFKPILIF